LKSGRESGPQGPAIKIRALQEMVTVFGRGATLRWTDGGRALQKLVLLLLEGKNIVYPFYHKKMFEEAQAEGAVVEGVPIKSVENSNIQPQMVFA
jgi:hypothetical protein